MALLPGVTGPASAYEAGLTELFRMGFYDERQNLEALENQIHPAACNIIFIPYFILPPPPPLPPLHPSRLTCADSFSNVATLAHLLAAWVHLPTLISHGYYASTTSKPALLSSSRIRPLASSSAAFHLYPNSFALFPPFHSSVFLFASLSSGESSSSASLSSRVPQV